MATKKQKVISEFAHLSQFLEEQQNILLAQLEKLDEDILKHRDEFDVLVTGEIGRFNTLIEELEEKKERPARELLTVRAEPRPTHHARLGFVASLPSEPSLLHSQSFVPQVKYGSQDHKF